MTAQEFIQYRKIVAGLATLALRGLGPIPGAGAAAKMETGSVLLAVPAARLLMEDDAELYGPLAEGFRELARMGRGAGGLNSGTSAGAPTGRDSSTSAFSGKQNTGGQVPTSRDTNPILRDPAGHARDLYHPLVLHLHLAAFQKYYETLPVNLWGACEDALPDACLPIRSIEENANHAPPPARVALVLWQALCLLEESKLAGRDVDVELVESVVHAIVSQPGPEGSLHPRNENPGDGDSLDAWTYRELAGLHALASLALAQRNTVWAARVEEIAIYHVNNTQPDNTTNQPWGLAAFFWSPRTRSFGEQQLHDATAHGIGPVAALLMADAANALAVLGR